MQKTTLICNNFSGINRNASQYSSSLITASDLQNVELFSTENNSGVGIRTANGNIAISEKIPQGETVVNIFESVQKSKVYFFVHTESSSEGKIYLFIPETKELNLKVSGLSTTGKSSATDVTQGWSDLCFFSNSEEILSIEIEKYNFEGELNELTMMNLLDTDGRKVKGLGLVVFAGRLWIFNNQVLWYTAFSTINSFVNNNMGNLLDEYLNPTLNSVTNQAKMNAYVKALNSETAKNVENNIINPLSNRNMIRSCNYKKCTTKLWL